MCYMTDVDTDGNLSDFHHDRNKAEGFCIVRDLFYTVKNEDGPCADWICDNE